MNCKEFKKEFKDFILLAFVASNFTHIFKFDSEYITFFMRKFIDDNVAAWKTIYFYSIKSKNIAITEKDRIYKFEEKADFLFVKAKHEDQIGNQCKFRRTITTPDTSNLEGKYAKVISLNPKYIKD